ncbi:protease [Acidianus rod-shaped virus 1]|uniref:Uncharacterized protein n=1 Tax=Acidianus rod-shaped virus 1 TaxID=309181 RepID=Q50I55_9VIRU|nr:protease [Acidianus rod-shaped virus 1]CAI44171.1 hypothetical protein [Acidianus rod-shaped virus 1]
MEKSISEGSQPQNQSINQLQKLVEDNSFFFNPRDENRFLYYIFKNGGTDDKKKQNALKAFRLGYDVRYFEATKVLLSEFKFISRIVRYKEKDGLLQVKFQNGFTGSIDPHMLADNPDDLYNALQSYLLVKINKSSNDWEIIDAYPIEPPNNVEVAKSLFELADAEHSTAQLLLSAFGYDTAKMSDEDALLTLPRLMPLFVSPYSKRRFNIIEISNPGTGKTSLFTLLQEIFNFRYYTEPPTYANLIYDARNNIMGAVYLSKGLIFDEIQTWKDGNNISQIGAINATLSTGIENCLWTRGAGTETDAAVLHSCLPIIYAGNPVSSLDSFGVQRFSEDGLSEFLDKYEVFTKAILDRIHIIHVTEKKTYDQIGSRRVLYPSVLKSLIQLVQDKLNRQTDFVDCGNFKSRRHEQAIDVELFLQAVDVNFDKDKVCQMLEHYLRIFR